MDPGFWISSSPHPHSFRPFPTRRSSCRGALRSRAAAAGVVAALIDSSYSTARPERLDAYVNNELAMSYLAEGSGAKFVGFLQPYLSVKHKILGDSDREAIKAQDPALLE